MLSIGLHDPRLTQNHPWYWSIAKENREKAEREEEKKREIERIHQHRFSNVDLEDDRYAVTKDEQNHRASYCHMIRRPEHMRNAASHHRLSDAEDWSFGDELATPGGLASSMDTTAASLKSSSSQVKPKFGGDDGPRSRSSVNQAATTMLGVQAGSKPGLSQSTSDGKLTAPPRPGMPGMAEQRCCSRCGHRPGSRSNGSKGGAHEPEDFQEAQKRKAREFAIERAERRKGYGNSLGATVDEEFKHPMLSKSYIGLADPALTARHPWFLQLARPI